LDGPDWRIVEEAEGRLVVDVPLVERVKNYRGHLFGGFAPAYVDLIALRTVSAGQSLDAPHGWLVTVNLRVEYLEPVDGPRFVIESKILHRRGRTILVEVRFRDPPGTLLLFATVLLREKPPRDLTDDRDAR
jgi:acyl-coenzyme A thioesterase PaaI-like protein